MRKIVGPSAGRGEHDHEVTWLVIPERCGPSVLQNCRSHFTFTALDTIWTLLYHTMLKFSPYHKFWCCNEKLPMIFHFWCIPSHVCICSFELCEKVDQKKKLIVKISNLSTKRVVRKCSDCVKWSFYVHPLGCNNGGGGGNLLKVKRLVLKCIGTQKRLFPNILAARVGCLRCHNVLPRHITTRQPYIPI